ncbi:MAG: EAL domain-containing protein [Aquisalimonadaceae bacterium]
MYKQAFLQHAVVMLLIDAESGGIVQANTAAGEFYGLAPDALRQLHLCDISLLEPDRFRQLADEIRRGERNRFELRHRHSRGGVRDLEIEAALVNADGRQLLHAIVRDVTEQRLVEARARDQEERLNRIADNILGVVYQFELVARTGQFRMPYASPGISDIFRVKPDEVRENAAAVLDRIHPDDLESTLRSIEDSGRSLMPWHRELRLYFPPEDGRPERTEWIEGHGTPQSTADGNVLWHGFISLITKRKKLEDQLVRQAYYDALTALPNRTLFHDRLAHAINLARRSKRRIAVLYMDLDGFKDINDGWGHAAGDQVLRVVAERITSNLRAGDTVARLGGDELVVIAEGLDHPNHATVIASKLRDLFHAPIDVDHRQFTVHTSIGISIFPDDGDSAESLLQHADAALYRAKGRGGNQWAFSSPELADSASERIIINTELKRAIESEGLGVALQPLIRLQDGAAVGMEALARWYHHQHGWIAPARFIPVAESTGLIHQLGEWVLRAACIHAAGWSTDDSRQRIAVNVSIRQLQSPEFVGKVRSILADTGLDPARLELEITESAFADDNPHIISRLNSLRADGVTLAIDDFGTGFSSLQYLKRLPVDRLKIDRCFVHDLPHDAHNHAIVRAIVTLARDFGLELTAEGVETREQATFLASVGCETVQGYYYGQPQLMDAPGTAAYTARTSQETSPSDPP